MSGQRDNKVWNEVWDEYSWPLDGDEWSDQASFSKVSYETWKRDLIEDLIHPFASNAKSILEIAPGHGRWTPYLVPQVGSYIGVDMNANCVNFCRKKFESLTNASFQVNDGLILSGIGSASIDFVWSFDSFVHMDADVTNSYVCEVARCLALAGKAVIHHPGNPTPEQQQGGWRSRVNQELFSAMVNSAGLRIVSQMDAWGPEGRSNTRLFADCISIIEKNQDCATSYQP